MAGPVEVTVVRFATAPTSFGRVLVADAGAGLCLVALNEDSARARLDRWVRAFEPEATVREDGGALAAAVDQLVAYGEGRRDAFELRLDLRGTSFERAVWAALCRIPYGRTSTYGALARELGRPDGARAVGRAAGRNPVPVVVPCHRLLAADGLGGFTGGLQHKRRLLALEGVPTAHQTEFA